MGAIQIEGLTKHYKDVVAVDNLNLSVKQGEIFSLLGVKGAGGTDTAAFVFARVGGCLQKAGLKLNPAFAY